MLITVLIHCLRSGRGGWGEKEGEVKEDERAGVVSGMRGEGKGKS